MRDPSKIRRQDAPDWPLRRWIRWRFLPLLPTRFELREAYYDARAMLLGFCNVCPAHPDSSKSGGGYPFWRCNSRRRHAGPHRFINYVWDGDGRVRYEPTTGPTPKQDRPTSASGGWWFRVRRRRWHRRWDREQVRTRMERAGRG